MRHPPTRRPVRCGVLTVRVFYSDQFVLPLPPKHRFPMRKYALLRRRILEEGLVAPRELSVPAAATDEQLCRAHEADYVRRVQAGNLTADEVRLLGLPWSGQLVQRSRRSVGGTIAACRAALREGCAVNLAGGTHHAFADRGEGFCVFNDSMVAARAVQAEQRAERVVVIDCDVHQGNGTAAMAAGDASIFTFSIHSARNYPRQKPASDLDVALEDESDDAAYLAALESGLEQALAASRPQLAIFLAGADPFEHDRFGRLKLTQEGLRQRDRLVLAACRRRSVAVAVTMAGGYAPAVEEIVALHAQTVGACRETWFGGRLGGSK